MSKQAEYRKRCNEWLEKHDPDADLITSQKQVDLMQQYADSQWISVEELKKEKLKECDTCACHADNFCKGYLKALEHYSKPPKK